MTFPPYSFAADRIFSIVARLSDFAPMVFQFARSGSPLRIERHSEPVVLTRDRIPEIVDEISESGDVYDESRLTHRAIGTCLAAQRMVLFPVRIDYPEASTDWNVDVARGYVESSLRGLADAKKSPITEIADDTTRRQVADVVIASLERIAKRLPHHFESAHDGMLLLDAALADELESAFGEEGRNHASVVRTDAKERYAKPHSPLDVFRPWLPEGFLERPNMGGLPWIRPLGRAAWFDVVRPKLERERKKPPALAYPVHENVARIHSRTHTLENKSGQRHLVFGDHAPIAVIEDDTLGRIADSIARGIPLLGTMTSHKALQWEVITGHRQALEGVADARVLTIEGGWSTFARDELGLSAKSDIENLRDIVRAQSAIRAKLPDGSVGNLLALREVEAKGRRRGLVELVLGTMLMPHYVHELDGKLSGLIASESKRLVPMTGLPPPVGSRTEHGAQVTLSMHVVRELRARATELVTDGGTRIELDRWAALAMTSGVKAANIRKIIDRWTIDGPDGAAFLRRSGPDRYTLGDAHAPARLFLEAAGKMSLDASAAGRKSIESKARARTGTRRRGGRAG